MASKIFYASLQAKIIGFARTATAFEKFKLSSFKIVSKMMKQGGTKSRTKCFPKIHLHFLTNLSYYYK